MKMSDFELFKALQNELVETLEKRKNTKYVTHETSKAKINRLRLSINEVMLRIERKCVSFYKSEPEGWE